MFGVNEAERLPPSAYQAEINARVYDQLLGRAATIIAQGHSVILDAVFAQETERALAAETARKLNRPFLGLFLATDLATRQSRIAGRESDASDATGEVAAVQQSYNIGTVDWAVIDASGTPEQTLKPCQTRISEQIRRQ
jgi:predicted kinase